MLPPLRHAVQEAPAAGVGLQQRSLSLEELAALVAAGRHFIIALVDKRKLEEGSLTAAALPPAVVVPIGLPPQGFTGDGGNRQGQGGSQLESGVARNPSAALLQLAADLCAWL